MSLARGTQIGPYEIEALLGAGGMGQVYQARDHRLGRAVAIKVLNPSPASEGAAAMRLERFAREARAIARLSHPNICTIHDVGDQDGMVFLVMELLEGETLADRLERGALPLSRALPIAAEIAEALNVAHRKGVIHRDLKPGNVMLTATGVKLLDFGLAKLREVDIHEAAAQTTAAMPLTDQHTIVGTVPYMAPEQIEGRPVDARTDIFSFGVMLFEMIAGRRPFAGTSRASIMAAIVGAEPPSIASLEPATPASLERVINRCLSKDPEYRWQTARDLATELQWIEQARTHGNKVERSRNYWSRRRVIVGGLAAGTILFGAFAGVLELMPERQPRVAEYTQTTFRRGIVSSARFSPDDQGVVYSASWDAQPYRVFLGRPGSPDARDLNLESARVLSLSGASDMAVIFGPQNVQQPFGLRRLARIPMAGGARRDLLDGVVDADWIPGTDSLAVIRDRGGNQLWSVEFPAGRMVHEASAAWSLRVSPDGRRIAFFEGPTLFSGFPDSTITLIDDLGHKSSLTKGLTGMGLAWSPGGNEIWFTATRAGDQPGTPNENRQRPPWLHAVTLRGQERTVHHAPDWLVIHDIAADGRVLMSRNTIRISMACQPPGDSTTRDLSWQASTIPTSLSADGQTVIFNDTLGGVTPSGNPTVFRRGTDGSPAVALGEGTGGQLSPDGKWVLAKLQDHLVLLPAGAGSIVHLPNGSLKEISGAAWLDSDRIVLTGHLENGPPRGFVQEIPAGAPQAITPENVPLSTRGAVRNAASVLASFRGQWMLYSVAGGEPQSVRGLAAIDVPVQWSLDGRFVYAAGGFGPISLELVRVEPATGHRVPWKALAPADPVGVEPPRPNVVISADGRSYCYSYMRRLGDLFVVTGLK